ncbi:DivIVA domain-containing protein [Melioribacter sp. OK-6-Me]|uniref:DivIVA domain-containing protein n=1 Tax=unclassified Melioribacter TaxID=2627329 RepID=UPI003ED93683
MKFTPYGIKNQEFNKSVRGYDRDEVKAFLERLADEFEKISSENEKLQKELELKEEQLTEYKRLEKNLQAALLSATETTSKAVDSTKKQTALMIKEAEIKATQMIEKAKASADALRESIVKLREEKKLLISKLKAMVDTQSNLMEMIADKNKTMPDLKLRREIKDDSQKEEQTDINVDDILEKLL